MKKRARRGQGFGVRFTIYGLQFTMFGLESLVSDLRFTVYGLQSMALMHYCIYMTIDLQYMALVYGQKLTDTGAF